MTIKTFIQWKGTDLCMDFFCDCGGGGHFCGFGAYAIQCPDCKTYYEMPTDVPLKKLDAMPEHMGVLFSDEGDGL